LAPFGFSSFFAGASSYGAAVYGLLLSVDGGSVPLPSEPLAFYPFGALPMLQKERSNTCIALFYLRPLAICMPPRAVNGL